MNSKFVDDAIGLAMALLVASVAGLIMLGIYAAFLELTALKTNTVTIHKQDRLPVACQEGGQ